jgi:hypothetical protein
MLEGDGADLHGGEQRAARLVLSDKPDDGAVLRAVAHLAMILAPKLAGAQRMASERIPK